MSHIAATVKPWRAKRRQRLHMRHIILLVASPEDDSSYTESVDWAAWSEEASQASKEGRAVDRCTTSINSADDYAHRGRKLSAMPYYVYRMYVYRVRSPSNTISACSWCFPQRQQVLMNRFASARVSHPSSTESSHCGEQSNHRLDCSNARSRWQWQALAAAPPAAQHQ